MPTSFTARSLWVLLMKTPGNHVDASTVEHFTESEGQFPSYYNAAENQNCIKGHEAASVQNSFSFHIRLTFSFGLAVVLAPGPFELIGPGVSDLGFAVCCFKLGSFMPPPGASDAKGKCLSLHQPWASLLVFGVKRIEGRPWSTDYRGRLWIHATSKQPTSTVIQAGPKIVNMVGYT